ncbi:MAG TPA: RNA 2',3'-cyclic phosphodiesterase [Shewanella frigidimarina]|nr:RNA 2',3'-cyclic phosphodiesterase [Shewanella frigidimarina]
MFLKLVALLIYQRLCFSSINNRANQMQTPSSARLFVGFSLDKPQIDKILHLQQTLITKINTNSVATLAHNLHITLGFLGQIDPTTCSKIREAINQMPKTTFSQIIDTFAWWQTAQLICLKGQASTSLNTMANDIKNIAKTHHLAVSQYDYVPHISLFRGVTTASLPTVVKDTQLIIAPSHLHLYQSTGHHNNVNYTILESWPLLQK